MKQHLKPYWLFISVTIPHLVLFWVFYRVFDIIGSQLDQTSLRAWAVFGSVLGVLWLGTTLYGIFCTLRNKDIKPYIGIGLMVLYIAFLYVYLLNSRTLIPWSIPRWMLSDLNAEIVVITLTMPVLAYSMLLTVFWLTPGDNRHALWKDLIAAVSIPLVWYLGVQIFIPLLRGSIHLISPHVIAVLLVVSTACFLFFITRLALLLLMNRPLLWKYVKIPIVAVFPLLGLVINNGLVTIFPIPYSFGDFSNPLFYVLALITGVLLLLPEYSSRPVRLALFFGKAVTAVYTFYFFIVFLPYLPLSVLAVIAAGLGFLMLTPLALLLVHAKSLWTDIQFLRSFVGRYQLLALLLAGLAVLPAGVFVTYRSDAANLDKALKYVYEPDYRTAAKATISTEGIKRTLENVKRNRKTDGVSRFLTTDSTPYLTSVYNWLVLDNLTLSDSRVKRLEQVFFGEQAEAAAAPVTADAGEQPVKINACKTETRYDEKGGFYRSWIHFELTNQAERQSEYATSFLLPPGSWITDYYLYVGDKQKFGILADKRAATWVYQQIVSERRDPGILHYLSGNKIAFKVFPFGAGELRKTGFELIHREPVQLVVDGQHLNLADSSSGAADNTELILQDGSAAYIPSKLKERLPLVNRKPYYHFIVDFSHAGPGTPEEKFARIQVLLDKNLLDPSGAVITAANYRTKTVELKEDWKEELKKLPREGGFFLEHAIKKALVDNYRSGASRYPIVVVVSDHLARAVMSDDFAEMKFAFPETDSYYELNAKGQLYSHSLTERDKAVTAPITVGFPEKSVRAWPEAGKPLAYLPDDPEASLVLLKEGQFLAIGKGGESLWEKGLYIHSNYRNMVLNPNKYGELNLRIIEDSFRTRVMTPLTSYIVVENKAQEKALLEKQKQLLSTKKQLDLGGATQMSEPALWMLLLPLFGIAVIRKIRDQSVKYFD